MATIKYKCDTCKREIEIIEKPYNMNVFAKCIITEGCKGKLSRLSRNLDNFRSSLPKPVDNLIDYSKRKVFYEHRQNLIGTVWKIKHNLGIAPAVEVYVSNNGNFINLNFDDYEIKIIDKNTIHIIHATPQTGIVHCIARSTVNDYIMETNTNVELFQVTTNGLFVFAFPKYVTHYTINPPNQPPSPLPIDTANPPKPIRIEVSIIQPNKEEVICVETIPNTINNNTPWLNWNEILLRKRRNYVVKTKSIFSFNRTLQLDSITESDISPNTQIRFLRIDYGTGDLQPIDQDGLLILISKAPYHSIDKIKDSVIDINNVLFSDFNHFIYKDGEVFTAANNIETIYPEIQRIS